jgi:tetratricopeptide (TPR) repeat protein
MTIDPENPVVKLCAEGMNLEVSGDKKLAHQKFQEAWNLAGDDYEAFIAAHYLARHQETPEDKLRWNLESLNRALNLKSEQIGNLLPSLYLNLGKSYENLAQKEEAVKYYTLAEESSGQLGPGPYAEMIKGGISNGLKRMGIEKNKIKVLDQLIDGWCERKDLRPLSFALPAYLGYHDTDRNPLISALGYLSAARCLNPEEQGLIDKLVLELSCS